MPDTYSVKQVVGEPDSWESSHGKTMLTYELMLEGPAGVIGQTVQLNQVHSTPAPTEGQELILDIDWNGSHGPKARKVNPKYEGSSNGSSGGDDFARRPEHPSNEARMKRTASISSAPAYYELLLTAGVVPKPTNKEEALTTLKGLIKWIEGNYESAPQEAATQPAPPPQPTPDTVADRSLPFARPRIPDRSTRRRDLFGGDKWLA